VARAKAEAPLAIEDVCAAAKNRGGFTGQYEDLVEHAHIFINEIIYQLLDGFSVQLGGFCSLHTKISGTYHGANDHIGAENLHVAFRTLRHLKELLLKVKIENEGIAGDGAYIDEIIDVHTESVNSAITSGNMIHIVGNKIKVEGEDSACGVWFVSQADSARVKIAERLGINRASEIVGTIPSLTAGTYKLEIVTQFSSGSFLLKEPRTVTLPVILTVA
jgi:nucleoid DNA-binding protein